MDVIIEKLKQEARESWSGQGGEDRATRLEEYLRAKLKEYSDATNIPQKELLEAWEEHRDYSAINYYQEANQPKIDASHVRVFDKVEDFFMSVGDDGFRCPSCKGISKDPYECDSGLEMSEGKTCDWKVYGLFRDMGQGSYVFLRDKMRGNTIFKPIAWELEE